jgi:iron complex outermembrane receptor protein
MPDRFPIAALAGEPMTNNIYCRFLGRHIALYSSVALIALGSAGGALAQETGGAPVDPSLGGGTPAPTSDEIVVTGIRASLDASAKLKRNTPTIVESVSAEDIGKLPDVSIADSLARLPGVTAQRLEGRDQRLSIRGLGPDFGTTLLNGREQVTVGDNRGVEYDQYPSEFFQNVVVHKTADASLIAAGIAGTVDLRSIRPLEVRNRIIQIQARGELNEIKALNPDGARAGYRVSGTFVDKFADDTFGVAVGISATSAPTQDERYNAWGYATDPISHANNALLGGAKPYVQSNVLDRIGAVGTLEWRPSERFHSTLDLLYSHFEETQHLRGIEFPMGFSVNNSDPNAIHVSNITSTADGFDTAATFSNVHAVQRNDYNQRKADNYSIGWNNEFAINETTHFKTDLAYSRADRTDFLLETYTGDGYNHSGPGDTVRVTQNANGTFKIVPTLDYTDTNIIKITDPNGWGYNGTQTVVQSGFLNKPKFKDELYTLRASLDGEFGGHLGLIKGWEIGTNFSERQKTSAFTSFFLCPPGGGTGCTVASGTPTAVPVPDAAKLGSNIPLGYLGVPAVLTLNPLYLYNHFLNSAYDNRPVSLVRDNSVTEDVATGYALLKIDGTVGGVPVAGSAGAQVVSTDQKSSGSISNFSNGVVTVVPAYGSDRFTYFLPSVALSFEVIRSTFVKIGGSRTMVRPRLDQERVNQEFSVNLTYLGSTDPTHSVFSSNGGNVRLRPYLSDNADISVERYFRHGGYMSVAGYYKHLTNYVDANSSFLYDFSGGLSALSAEQRAQVGTSLGLVSAPNNDGKGNLYGVEGTISLPFSNFGHALDGFGVFGSASYTYSNIKLGSNTTPITLPGLSDLVVNGEVYYEKHGFQARVSYRYRSAFLGEVAGLSANPTFRNVQAEEIVDAQIGYEFQSGFAKGLSILAQAKNLTDRPFITFQNNDLRQVIDYQRYGRDYYVGFAYKF